MPRKYQKLPRQTIWVDERGRITVPAYLREAAGIEAESWVEVSADPSLEKCKGLLIRSS